MASAQGRLDGTRFAALVFTNLTQDHLDFHGTMERYFEAKRRLFAQASARGRSTCAATSCRAATTASRREIRRRLDHASVRRA